MKKLLSFLLVFCSLLSMLFVFPVSSQEDYKYAYLDSIEVSSYFAEYEICLFLLDPAEDILLAECASLVTVNGTVYNNAEDLSNDLPTGIYVRYTLNDDYEITSIDYGENCTSYSNVCYDTQTETFEGIANLPIYLLSDGWPMLPYLDENHTYDIDVYPYGIEITNMTAINYDYEIFKLCTYKDIRNFSETALEIYGEHIVGSNIFLKADLYSSSQTPLQSITTPAEYGIIFENLPNQTVSYTIKICLQDSSGTQISPLYTLDCDVKKADVGFGRIIQKRMVSEFGKDAIELGFLDNTGTLSTYMIYDYLYINNEYKYSVSDFSSELSIGGYAAFTYDYDTITSLCYDDVSNQTLTGTKYNTATGTFADITATTTDLPVYYENPETHTFATPYLDDNHTYDLNVYDFGIVISDMCAVNYNYTVDYITVEEQSAGPFTKAFNVLCETENSTTDTKFFVELYDSNSNLVFQEEGSECLFSNLPNTTSNYSLKIWMENLYNEQISPIYTITCSTSYSYFSRGTISQISYSDFDTPYLTIQDSDGYEISVSCIGNIFINGNKYSDINPFRVGNEIYFTTDEYDNLKEVFDCDLINAANITAKYNNGSLNTAIIFDKIISDCTVMLGVYNSDNKLITTYTTTAYFKNDYNEVSFNVPVDCTGYTIKAFFWNTNTLTTCGNSIGCTIS